MLEKIFQLADLDLYSCMIMILNLKPTYSKRRTFQECQQQYKKVIPRAKKDSMTVHQK